MREIVFDTETTGREAETDRIIEIGCLELHNHLPTGRSYWVYCNPGMAVSDGAFKVHGISDAFLADKPPFADIVDDFLAFIGDAPLIAHNAEFDIGFLNAELARLGRAPLVNTPIDTLAIARRRFPGAPASLDALCKRFGIDNTERDLHGALLDSQLLAEVYLELKGGRQRSLGLGANAAGAAGGAGIDRPYRAPRPHQAPAQERAAHRAMLASLKEPLWVQYGVAPPAAAGDD